MFLSAIAISPPVHKRRNKTKQHDMRNFSSIYQQSQAEVCSLSQQLMTFVNNHLLTVGRFRLYLVMVIWDGQVHKSVILDKARMCNLLRLYKYLKKCWLHRITKLDRTTSLRHDIEIVKREADVVFALGRTKFSSFRP
jgi:hypothetical protein